MEEKSTVFRRSTEAGMGRPKWHSSNHAVDAFENFGTAEYLDAGIFERSHSRLKTSYNPTHTYKNKSTARTETLAR